MIALYRHHAPSMGLAVVLLGGWAAGYAGLATWLAVAPSAIVALGLVGGGLLNGTPSQKGRDIKIIVHVGFALCIVLYAGAVFQLVTGTGAWLVATGFAASVLMSALTAGLPLTRLSCGMVAVRGLAFANAAYLTLQAFIYGARRPVGIFEINTNAIAGFLVVVAIHWLAAERGSRRSVIGSLILLLPATLTGSRWAMLVFCLMLGWLWFRRAVGWKEMLLLLIVPAVFVLQMQAGYGRFVGASIEQQPSVSVNDAAKRLATPLPGLLPHGFLGALPPFGDGGHDTYSRIGVEAGVLGLALFVGVLGLGLLRAPFAVRAGLATLVLLGVADYYIWGPFQLAPLLWAFLGMAVQREPCEASS